MTTKGHKAIPEWVKREAKVADRVFAPPGKAETSVNTTISREYKEPRPWYSDQGDDGASKGEASPPRGYYKSR